MAVGTPVDYYTYIKSPEWKAKATAAKCRAGYRCQVCNQPSSQVQLDAHHRTYERLGNEDLNDITVLCHSCHELYEKSGKLPKHPNNRTAVYKTANTTPIQSVRKTNNPLNAGCLIWLLVIVAGYSVFVWPQGGNSRNEADRISAEATRVTSYVVATQVPQRSLKLYHAIVASDASLRVGPDKSYLNINTIRGMTFIMIAGYNDESGLPWYCVKIDGFKQYGWISSELVEGAPKVLPFLSTCTKSAFEADTSVAAGSLKAKDAYDEVAADDAYQAYLKESADEYEAYVKESMADHQDILEDTGKSTGCIGGCTTYPTWCAGQPIKGNIAYESGEKIYHVAGQEYYEKTKIDPSYGERWFCTEQEAQAAGWRKASK